MQFKEFGMENTYAEQVKRFISLFGSITHKDIIRITDGNCPYSTLRDLRKKVDLIEQWETDPDTKKRYKRYYIAA
jgi:hypothetical protein